MQDHRENDVEPAWSIGYAIGKITKGAATSWQGGAPNIRRYSRLNWDGLLIPDPKRSPGRVESLARHQAPGLLEAKPLLVLERARARR